MILAMKNLSFVRAMIGAVGFAVFLGFATVACGDGGAAVGEACDTRGSTTECAEDAVCDQDKDGNVVCLALCETQDDCAADESCDGVSGGSLKACHPK
jgi:hypothetical protein